MRCGANRKAIMEWPFVRRNGRMRDKLPSRVGDSRSIEPLSASNRCSIENRLEEWADGPLVLPVP
jgi:hypothetical protein